VVPNRKFNGPSGQTGTYSFHPPHRNGAPSKSQWTISENEEFALFVSSNGESARKGPLFGLRLHNKKPTVIGVSAHDSSVRCALRIAKFVGNPTTWHGYPADYRRTSSDRPPTQLLLRWRTAGWISKSVMYRIRTGQLCDLSR
jgi:hypothetical protein